MNIVKEKHLGTGSYGDVYKVIDRNNGNHIVALKTMKNNPENNDIRDATIREIINTQNIVHPNIIPVDPLVYSDRSRHAVYIDDIKNCTELSLEMMNGDINSLQAKDFTPELLRKLVHDVTKGLYHMHSMGYTHNDLKPDNILYKLEGDKYTFKIGDFGLSQYLGIPFPDLSKIFIGSTHIKAPNSVDDSYYLDGNKYNYNSDMFSLGATMFWICMRVHGVRWTDFRVSETEVFVDIRKKNFLDQVVKVKGMYGEDGYNFLIKCMEPKSSNRMSSKKALEHPYLRPLRGGAFEDILTKITKMYREPTMDEIIRGKYELEFLEDMYNCYKDRRVNLYVDFTKKSVDVVPRHMPTLFNWLYDSSNSFKFPTLETFFQAQLSFINILNNKKLSKTDLQLWGIGTLNICHKLLSDLVVFSIDIDDLVWVSLKQFTPKQLIGVQKDILRTLGGNIQVTPVTFFLNYWYLKSIYTGTRKVPNVNVLSTSISAMLALMVSNTKPELQNVKLDDLAKYCVKKALVLEGYTHGANVDILTIPSGLESLLNTCITESCSIDIEYQELYRSIKNTLKCK